MRLRNRFALFFVSFAVVVCTLQGWLSYKASQTALEAEISRKLVDVAGVVGRVSFGGNSDLLELRAGDEGGLVWLDYHKLLERLTGSGYADDGVFFRWTPGADTATLVVGLDPADAAFIGQELNWVQPHIRDETMWEAHEQGSATTETFPSLDGQTLYKWGIVSLGPEAEGIYLGLRMPVDHLEPLSRLGWTVVALTAASALAAALLGWRLAGGIASRLES